MKRTTKTPRQMILRTGSTFTDLADQRAVALQCEYRMLVKRMKSKKTPLRSLVGARKKMNQTEDQLKRHVARVAAE